MPFAIEKNKEEAINSSKLLTVNPSSRSMLTSPCQDCTHETLTCSCKLSGNLFPVHRITTADERGRVLPPPTALPLAMAQFGVQGN